MAEQHALSAFLRNVRTGALRQMRHCIIENFPVCAGCAGSERYYLRAYLRHVLTELSKRPAGADVADLLPFNFVTS